jgi:hypothetical protein
MTVRKVVTRSGGHSRGLMPSIKNTCSAAWESSWELKFYQLLELSPSVRQYIVQPTREPIIVDGNEAAYIPDVQAFFIDGTSVFFEIKPALKCRTQLIAKRLIAIRKRFVDTDRRFHLITDDWLSKGPRAANITRLMFHRRDQLLTYAERRTLCQIITTNQPRTIDALFTLVGATVGWLLLGLSIVGVDLDLPLNLNSVIFLSGGHRHENFFS